MQPSGSDLHGSFMYQQTTQIDVSKFLLQSYLKDHIFACSTEVTIVGQSHSPLSQDEALPGNIAVICRGPFIHRSGTIEWINTDGNLWSSSTAILAELAVVPTLTIWWSVSKHATSASSSHQMLWPLLKIRAMMLWWEIL